MVTLRATRKVLCMLPPALASPSAPRTALGDWFVDRLVLDQQPLLLLVSSASLLSIIVPAQGVRGLPDRLVQVVGARLRRLGVSDEEYDLGHSCTP